MSGIAIPSDRRLAGSQHETCRVSMPHKFKLRPQCIPISSRRVRYPMNDHEDCHVSYDYGIVLRHRHLLRSLTIHGQFSSRVSFVEYFWGRTAVLRLARFVMANSLMPHTYVWRRYVVNWHLKVTQSSKNQKVVEHVPINKGNKQTRKKQAFCLYFHTTKPSI